MNFSKISKKWSIYAVISFALSFAAFTDYKEVPSILVSALPVLIGEAQEKKDKQEQEKKEEN